VKKVIILILILMSVSANLIAQERKDPIEKLLELNEKAENAINEQKKKEIDALNKKIESQIAEDKKCKYYRNLRKAKRKGFDLTCWRESSDSCLMNHFLDSSESSNYG
jgi:hypothetical protein